MGYTLIQPPPPQKPNRFAKYRVIATPVDENPFLARRAQATAQQGEEPNPFIARRTGKQLPEGFVMGPAIARRNPTQEGTGNGLPEGFVMGPPVVPNRFAKYRTAATPDESEQPFDGEGQTNLATKVNKDGSVPNLAKQGGDIAFVQGGTFGFGDEIVSGIAAPIATVANRMGYLEGDALPDIGENYQQGLAQYRAAQARNEAEHPIASTVNQIAGGMAWGKAFDLLSKGGIVAKTAKGVGLGAGVGALSGFGDGTDFNSRMHNAQQRAAIGGVVGGVAVPLSKLAGATYSGFANRRANRAMAKELDVSPKAARGVMAAYGDDVATGLNSATDDADLLLNRGQSLRSQAEEIASQQGQGRNVIAKAIGAQSQGASSRTQDTLDKALGRDAGRVVNKSAIETERQAAGQMFTIARSHNGSFDVSPLAKNLDTMIGETDGSIRAALVKTRNLQLFKTGPQGASAMQLHAARLALDDILRKPGLGNNAARMLRDVRGQIDNTLKTNVQGWQQADDAYVAVSKKSEALQAGREIFQRSFGSPQELAHELRQMTPAARAEFLKGARDSVAEIIGSSRNELSAARRELLDKGWNRDKLGLLIGRDRAGMIERQLIAETRRVETAQSISAKSREATASNAARAFPGAANRNDLKGVSLTGIALQSGNWVLNKITGQRRAEISRQAATLLTRKASEVEPLLQQAAQRVGRRLNVREQIEVISNALALSSMQSGVGQ